MSGYALDKSSPNHQKLVKEYAGIAMAALIVTRNKDEESPYDVAEAAILFAEDLVLCLGNEEWLGNSSNW